MAFLWPDGGYSAAREPKRGSYASLCIGVPLTAIRALALAGGRVPWHSCGAASATCPIPHFHESTRAAAVLFRIRLAHPTSRVRCISRRRRRLAALTIFAQVLAWTARVTSPLPLTVGVALASAPNKHDARFVNTLALFLLSVPRLESGARLVWVDGARARLLARAVNNLLSLALALLSANALARLLIVQLALALTLLVLCLFPDTHAIHDLAAIVSAIVPCHALSTRPIPILFPTVARHTLVPTTYAHAVDNPTATIIATLNRHALASLRVKIFALPALLWLLFLPCRTAPGKDNHDEHRYQHGNRHQKGMPGNGTRCGSGGTTGSSGDTAGRPGRTTGETLEGYHLCTVQKKSASVSSGPQRMLHGTYLAHQLQLAGHVSGCSRLRT